MSSASAHWPLVIVGGGPAAAMEAAAARGLGVVPLLVSRQWGGGIECMGSHRLQSYCSELDLGVPEVRLLDFVNGHPRSPTGAEYAEYVREVIASIDCKTLTACVTDLASQHDHVQLVLENGARLTARCVVLATGSTFKRSPLDTGSINCVSTEQAYRDLAGSRGHGYLGKHVVIFGGGNSAMQIAALAEPLARDVTILATKYIGMYPQESTDRFAWRSLSQITCELIAKSSRSSTYCERPRASVRFLIYETARVLNDALEFTYRREANRHPICLYSLPEERPEWPETCLRTDSCWVERIPERDCVIVTATGVTPNYPDKFAEALGSARLHEGRRTEAGVSAGRIALSGACSGARAVNGMTPVVPDLLGAVNRKVFDPVLSAKEN